MAQWRAAPLAAPTCHRRLSLRLRPLSARQRHPRLHTRRRHHADNRRRHRRPDRIRWRCSGDYASGGPVCTVGAGCGGYSRAGSWALSKTGAGTLVLMATTPIPAGHINGGTVSVGDDANLGAPAPRSTSPAVDTRSSRHGITISTARDQSLGRERRRHQLSSRTGTHCRQDLSGNGGLTRTAPASWSCPAPTPIPAEQISMPASCKRVRWTPSPRNSAHVVAAGATLDLNNHNQAIGSLAGAGTVLLGTATLTVAATDSDDVLGSISGFRQRARCIISTRRPTRGTILSAAASPPIRPTTNLFIDGGTLRAGTQRMPFFSEFAISTIVATGSTLDLNNFDQTIVCGVDRQCGNNLAGRRHAA